MAVRVARSIPSTRQRVRRDTDEVINRRIDDQIARNVQYFSAHSEAIDDRLAALDDEWHIERVIEAQSAGLALVGTILARRVSRVFLGLPMAATAFLLQHAIQGWCPPMTILRRLGFRTSDEINRERYALKALRGDFDAIAKKSTPASTANAALRAVSG